jgi:hypothetical protein
MSIPPAEPQRVLHFCWLVDLWKPSREQYLKAWQDAGWHCVLWHSGQVPSVGVPGVELRLAQDIVHGSMIEEVFAYELTYKSYAACADLFRYLVLYAVGGAYVDIDVLPGPEPVPLSDTALFGRPSRDPHPDERPSVEIRFIQSKAGDPVLFRLLTQAASNEKEFIKKRGYLRPSNSRIMARTGPEMAEKVLLDVAQENGVSLCSMLLRGVTEDNTVDNNKEHHRDVPAGIEKVRKKERKNARENRRQERRSKRPA